MSIASLPAISATRKPDATDGSASAQAFASAAEASSLSVAAKKHKEQELSHR